MDISGISASLEGVRDSLTSPFTIKRVTINAHTPYDEVPETTEPQVYSRAFFNERDFASLRIGLPSNISQIGFKSPGSVIENAISGGYSPEEAVKIYKAQRAYGLNQLGTQSGVSLLSRHYFEV